MVDKKAVQKTLIKHAPYVAAIIVLGIISPLTFFRDSLPQMSMDTWIPLHPIERLNVWSYVWDSFNYMLGQDSSTRIPLLFPYVLTWAVFEWLGFSLVLTQKIIYIQIFITAGLGMYYLGLTMFRRERLIAFVAAIVFMFNPVSLGYWQAFYVESLYGFASIPLTLGLFLSGIQQKRYLRYAIIAALSTLLFPAVNPPTYALMYITIALIAIYAAFEQRIKLAELIRYVGYFSIITIVLNLWWIVPFLNGMIATNALYVKQSLMEQRLQTSTVRATLINNLRLFGNNNWGYSYWGNSINGKIGYLYDTSLILVVMSLIYPILAFGALLRTRYRLLTAYLAAIALLFIFLSKGTMAPYGGAYAWLYDNLPGFALFRTPSDKMCIPVLLVYSLLIGVTVDWFYNWSKKHAGWMGSATVILILSILLTYQWPFFSGDAVKQSKTELPRVVFNLPQYYEDAAAWFRSRPGDFRLMSLPGANTPSRWVYYDWGFLGSYAVLSDIFGHPVIDKNPTDEGTSFRQSAYAALGDDTDIDQQFLDVPYPANISELIRMMGVKYIVLHRDVVPDHIHFGTVQPEALALSLDGQSGINHIKRFGKLDVYEVDDPQPKAYCSSNLTLLVGDEASSMAQIADAGLIGVSPAFISSSRLNAEELSTFDQKALDIVYIDASKDDVSVDMAPGGIRGAMSTEGLGFTVPQTAVYEFWLPRTAAEKYANSQILLKTEGSDGRAFTVSTKDQRKIAKWRLLSTVKLRPGKYVLSRGPYKDDGLLTQVKILPRKARLSQMKRFEDIVKNKDCDQSFLVSDTNLKKGKVSLGVDVGSMTASALVKPVNRYIQTPQLESSVRLSPLNVDTYENLSKVKTAGSGEIAGLNPLIIKMEPKTTFAVTKPILARDLQDSKVFTLKLESAVPDLKVSVIYSVDLDGNGSIDKKMRVIKDKQLEKDRLIGMAKISDSSKNVWIKSITMEFKAGDVRTRVMIDGFTLCPAPSPLLVDEALIKAQTGLYSNIGGGELVVASRRPSEKYLYDVKISNGYSVPGKSILRLPLTPDYALNKNDTICVLKAENKTKKFVSQVPVTFESSKNQKDSGFINIPVDLPKDARLKEIDLKDSTGREWSYAVDTMLINKLVDTLQVASVDQRGLRLALNGVQYIVKKRSDTQGRIWNIGETKTKNGMIDISSIPTDQSKIASLLLYDQKSYYDDRNFRRIKMHKLNPTKYIVDVDAGPPSWFVFNEGFSRNWRLSRIKATNESVSDFVHLCVNGYANAWRLNDIQSGRYFLEYTPQKSFQSARLVSVIGSLIALMMLIGESWRRKRRGDIN